MVGALLDTDWFIVQLWSPLPSTPFSVPCNLAIINNNLSISMTSKFRHPGGFKIQDAEISFELAHNFLHKNSYLYAVFRERNQEENDLWGETKRRRMPSYWELLKMEAAELTPDNSTFWGKVRCVRYIVPLLLCFFCVGHVFTKVGHRAYKNTMQKYFNFLQACCGVWTANTVEQYDVHGLILLMSVVWDKPFRRKSEKEYLRYRTGKSVIT